MGLEEVLSHLTGEQLELLRGVVATNFGTNPFNIGENPDYDVLAKLELLNILPASSATRPHTTTFQIPEDVYRAVMKGTEGVKPATPAKKDEASPPPQHKPGYAHLQERLSKTPETPPYKAAESNQPASSQIPLLKVFRNLPKLWQSLYRRPL